jgi:hypothetical protein
MDEGEKKGRKMMEKKGTYMGNGKGNEVDKERVRPCWMEGSSQSATHPRLN